MKNKISNYNISKNPIDFYISEETDGGLMLDKQIKRDIKIVLDYLWHDEERHYLESGYCKKHIFRVLKRLSEVVKDES